jgi:hypothetical protein
MVPTTLVILPMLRSLTNTFDQCRLELLQREKLFVTGSQRHTKQARGPGCVKSQVFKT